MLKEHSESTLSAQIIAVFISVLQGPWVEKEHCTVHNDNGIVTLAPIGGSHCIVNEMDVIHSCRLSQGNGVAACSVNLPNLHCEEC